MEKQDPTAAPQAIRTALPIQSDRNLLNASVSNPGAMHRNTIPSVIKERRNWVPTSFKYPLENPQKSFPMPADCPVTRLSM